ncbi:MAG: outer membrane protein assembly factor BamD [Gammaproteobacteria bacterium]|nr:outer membrane protein assembly factor BamD [Gammaproteobacteria bacterium]
MTLSAIALVSGCSSADKDPTKDWSPQRFYAEAKEAMATGNYETAIKQYETLEARFPYGRYAEQAQLEIAYAYYKNDEPALAISSADRFIRMHPTHPNVDYAYYLKGLVNFQNRSNPLANLFGAKITESDRDTRAAREAHEAFKELVTRFPNSPYAKDARQRMTYLFDALAQYEVKVARFYFEREAFVAAINRCKYVLNNFQKTRAAEDALGIQAMSYKHMGVSKLAEDSLRVLIQNFPESHYIDEFNKLKVKANKAEKDADKPD